MIIIFYYHITIIIIIIITIFVIIVIYIIIILPLWCYYYHHIVTTTSLCGCIGQVLLAFGALCAIWCHLWFDVAFEKPHIDHSQNWQLAKLPSYQSNVEFENTAAGFCDVNLQSKEVHWQKAWRINTLPLERHNPRAVRRMTNSGHISTYRFHTTNVSSPVLREDV